MKKFLATAAMGAALALSTGAASAATVSIADGGNYNLVLGDTYTYTANQTTNSDLAAGSSGGTLTFTFNFPNVFKAIASTVYLQQAPGMSLDGGLAEWKDGSTVLTSTSIADSNTFMPITIPTGSGSRTLQLSWIGVSGTSADGVTLNASVVGAVPLPATGLMLLGGLGALGVAKRRKKKAANA